MGKITRVTQRQFAANAPSGDCIEFGSLANGAPNYTKDPTIIQDLANFLTGWAAATIADNRPCLEDMNALFFLLYYQICYLFQAGIPEWDADTTYYENSFCQVDGVIYKSLVNNNINYAPGSNPTEWYPSIPIEEDILDYSAISTIEGWSSYDVKTISIKKIGKMINVYFDIAGTSDDSIVTFTIPYSSTLIATTYFSCVTVDNGQNPTVGFGYTGASTYTISIFQNSVVPFTASGTKKVLGQFSFAIV